MPALELDTWVIAIRAANDRGSADQIARKLRKAHIPVLSRVREGAVCLDLRTLGEDDLEDVCDAVEFAANPAS